MALPFETLDMILSKEQVEHINHRQVDVNDQRASKFKHSFNLTGRLALPCTKEWEGGYEIIEEGFKQGHGHYYICFPEG